MISFNYRLPLVIVLFAVLILFGLTPNVQSQQLSTSKSALVNTFIGSWGGNVFPGASLPFGIIKVSADIEGPQPTNGYDPRRPLIGLSHTHTSGTGGGGRYGNFLITPYVSDKFEFPVVYKVSKQLFTTPSLFSIQFARSGGDVGINSAVSHKAAKHEFDFYTWNKAKQIDCRVNIDISSTISRLVPGKTPKPSDSHCTGAWAKFDGRLLTAKASFAGGWGGDLPYTIYLAAQFPDNGKYQFLSDSTKVITSAEATGNSLVFQWVTAGGQHHKAMVDVAVSFVSTEQAIANLTEAQLPFAQMVDNGNRAWENWLGRIEIEGGNPLHQRMFYSCLRNTALLPADVTGENPDWASDAPAYRDYYTVWDIFRATMPLYSLIAPTRQADMVTHLLEAYQKYGWLPDAWVCGQYAGVQGGSNTDVMVADAFAVNLPKIDKKLAYQAILKNATVNPTSPNIHGRYLKDYETKGYLSPKTVKGSVSRSLEYAYNDYCVAYVAKQIGDTKVAKKMAERSLKIFDLFNPEWGYFWSKDSTNGKKWASGFAPDASAVKSWDNPYFYEGTPRNYFTYTPHAFDKLTQLSGGNEKLTARIDELFDGHHYELGNEPTFLTPYVYNYLGRPDRTAMRVRHSIDNLFKPTADGFPGQDDAGSISAWYVFSAMGLFPVAGQDLFLLGSPIFERIKINLENGKSFIVEAEGTSAGKIYVKSAKLNGVKLSGPYLKRTEVSAGGKLELEMSDIPHQWGTTPPSPIQSLF